MVTFWSDMCVETMDTTSKHFKTDHLRKTTKPASKLRWRLLRVSAEEAFNQCRATATVRRYLRREQKRTQLAKLAKLMDGVGEEATEASVCAESPAEACVRRHPSGAMAPENTTQYLMSNVYEDMQMDIIHSVPASHETSQHLYDESLSPRSVYAALDSRHDDSCLAFQQKDFEEVFELCW